MKTSIKLLLVGLLLGATQLQAQEFHGEATYKTSRSINIKMDSTKGNTAMQEKMIAMMKKSFQKTYILSFNREASVYKEELSLAAPTVGGSKISFMGMGGAGTDILYKNTKENRFVDQKDTMGKIFLVKDEMEKIEWKLENETKFIGEYTCFKATYTYEVEQKVNSDLQSATNANSDDADKEPEMETVTKTATAWYTPQIPISNGPDRYHGLPGLILEINKGGEQIVCTKIVINPKDSTQIEEPTKGKEINQADYDEIMEKKRKEMMEQFAPKGGRVNSEFIELKIGG
jgi:GLPGLI family protein